MGKNELEAKQWFAIRVTYSREMALKEYLDRCRMESFIPMSYKEVIKGERKVRKLVPVIHNLVFVRSTREKLDEIKRDISLKVPIRYIMDRETRRPLVVPDRQMHSFIAVAGLFRPDDRLSAGGRSGAYRRRSIFGGRGYFHSH